MAAHLVFKANTGQSAVGPTTTFEALMLADGGAVPSPPSQPRQQKNLRPRRQFLRPGIAIDRAVDRHRDALLDPGLYAGILFSQFPEQFPYVLRFDLALILASDGRQLARLRPVSFSIIANW